MYYQNVSGEIEQATQVYEMWAKSFPQDSVPRANLGVTYATLGQYDKSLDELLDAKRLEQSAVTYANLVELYLSVGQTQNAEAVIREAQKNNFESDLLHWYMYQIAFLKESQLEMEQQVSWASGKPG